MTHQSAELRQRAARRGDDAPPLPLPPQQQHDTPPSSSAATAHQAAPAAPPSSRTSTYSSTTTTTTTRSSSSNWVREYWRQAGAEWGCSYDIAAAACKAALLAGNVKRSVDARDARAIVAAGGAFGVVAATLALMLLGGRAAAAYAARRRLAQWAHLLAVTGMMAASMPQFVHASVAGAPPVMLLTLCFKMGTTWPMMAALMHRLPWQDLAALCAAFVLWANAAWGGAWCASALSRPREAAFVASAAAALDFFTGQGGSGGGLAPGAAAAAGGRGGGGGEGTLSPPHQERTWRPTAHMLEAACGASAAVAAPSEACAAARVAQCLAVTSALNAWVGVFVVLFCVLLAERVSKWQWWRQRRRADVSSGSGAAAAGGGGGGSSLVAALARAGEVVPPPPYDAPSTGAFLRAQLLQLHVLLDVPLLLLWAAYSWLHRRPALVALGLLPESA